MYNSFVYVIQSSKTAPSFTDLTELVAVVKTPNVPQSVLEKRARLFEYRSEGEDSDQDEVDYYSGQRGGTLSDQEIARDSEYLSGLEEGGYEVRRTSFLTDIHLAMNYNVSFVSNNERI